MWDAANLTILPPDEHMILPFKSLEMFRLQHGQRGPVAGIRALGLDYRDSVDGKGSRLGGGGGSDNANITYQLRTTFYF